MKICMTNIADSLCSTINFWYKRVWSPETAEKLVSQSQVDSQQQRDLTLRIVFRTGEHMLPHKFVTAGSLV